MRDCGDLARLAITHHVQRNGAPLSWQLRDSGNPDQDSVPERERRLPPPLSWRGKSDRHKTPSPSIPTDAIAASQQGDQVPCSVSGWATGERPCNGLSGGAPRRRYLQLLRPSTGLEDEPS